MPYWKWWSHIKVNIKQNIRDQKKVKKKNKENFTNMASKEKFNFSEAFISKYEK